MLTNKARKRFAEVVAKLRNNRDYRDFAKILKVAHSTVSTWEDENGPQPSSKNVEMIGQLYGYELDQFLEFLNSSEPINSSIDRLIKQIEALGAEDLASILSATADRVRLLTSKS